MILAPCSLDTVYCLPEFFYYGLMDFLLEQIRFLLSLGLVFLLPGLSIVAYIERKRRDLSLFERLTAGSALSVVSVGFLMIVMDRAGIPLTALSVTLGILFLSLAFFSPAWRSARKAKPDTASGSTRTVPHGFLLVFLGLLVVKSLYLIPVMLPSSTDLGHHLYWIEKITSDQTLPTYEEREILTRDDRKHAISEPLPISDFIIGEHLTLSAVRMISGRDFTTSFSVLTLFFLHIVTLVSVFALARRLFDHLPGANTIALWSFLFLGLLYAIGPPQMKYIEGGVVGNTYGNLLVPAILLSTIIALRKRRPEWLAVSVLLAFGLAYTHHLSMLLFAVTAGGILILYLILERERLRETLLPILRNRRIFLVLVGCGLFLAFVFTPSYLRNAAVETVVGAPDVAKAEHQGLPFSKLIQLTGEPRVALGLFGLLLLPFLRGLRRRDTLAFLLGWSAPLFLLALAPELARMDLPSGRVANYLEMPLAIAAGFAVAALIVLFQSRVRAPRFIGAGILFLLVATIFYSGTTDNSAYFRNETDRNARSMAITNVGTYLETRIPDTHGIVHDHINIPGNSLLKVFLLRDYNFPFYRAHLFRYDRSDREERCTLHLISSPGSGEAITCAKDLNIRAYVVSDADDGPQFERTRTHDRVYADPFHAIYTSYDD